MVRLIKATLGLSLMALFFSIPLGAVLAGSYYAFFPVDFRTSLRVFFGVVLAGEAAALLLLTAAVAAEYWGHFKQEAAQRRRIKKGY